MIIKKFAKGFIVFQYERPQACIWYMLDSIFCMTEDFIKLITLGMLDINLSVAFYKTTNYITKLIG